MDVPTWVWALTIAAIVGMLVFDFVGHVRTPHAPTLRESAIWSAVYVGIAVVFGLLILWFYGAEYGGEYFAGYITEKSLSVDNLFVFVLIMGSFAVPRELQQKVLLYGITFALVLRTVFILVGAAAIEQFSWIFYVFGAFLVWTAIAQARSGSQQEHEFHENSVLRLTRKILPTTEEYHSDRLTTRIGGKRYITPLAIALVAIGSADVLFAVDSIPAIFGLTQETFLVFAANAFSLLGLRQLFFLLDGLLDRLVYLHYGLAVILGFIGVKLLVHALHTNELPFVNGGEHMTLIPEIPTWLSLAVILVTLVVTTLASLLKNRSARSSRSAACPLPTRPPRRRGRARAAPRLVRDRHLRGVDRAAARRPRPRGAAAARAVAQGVGPVGDLLRRPGAVVRRRPADGHERPVRHRVLRRLADRVLAVGRQPVRLRDHHGAVQGAPGPPAGGPHGRDHHRPGPARDLHLARRRGDRPLHLGLLPLRRLPRVHRGQPAPAPRRGRGVRGERADPPAAPGPPAHRRVLRQQAAGRARGQEALDADARGVHRPRHDRPAVRARQHPGDLRADPRGLHRLHRERLRPDGAAPAVLPARRSAAPPGLPLAGAVGDPRVHRRQAGARGRARELAAVPQRREADRSGAGDPDLALADGHRGRPARRHRREPPRHPAAGPRGRGDRPRRRARRLTSRQHPRLHRGTARGHQLAVPVDLPHPPGQLGQVGGVAVDDDEIGRLARLEAAEAVVDPQQPGRLQRGRPPHLLGRHAERRHQRQLAEVGAVRADAGVGAHRDAHAGLRGAGHRGVVHLLDGDGLGQHRLGQRRPAGDRLEDRPGRRQRGHQPGAPLEHEVDRLLVEEDAVLDRADPGADRGLDAGGALRVRHHRHARGLRLLDEDVELGGAEVRVLRVVAGGEDPTAGGHLEHVGAGAQQLPDGAAHLVRPVDDRPRPAGVRLQVRNL